MFDRTVLFFVTSSHAGHVTPQLLLLLSSRTVAEQCANLTDLAYDVACSDVKRLRSAR